MLYKVINTYKIVYDTTEHVARKYIKLKVYCQETA